LQSWSSSDNWKEKKMRKDKIQIPTEIQPSEQAWCMDKSR